MEFGPSEWRTVLDVGDRKCPRPPGRFRDGVFTQTLGVRVRFLGLGSGFDTIWVITDVCGWRRADVSVSSSSKC